MIPNQEMLKVTGACSLSEQRRSVWKSPLPVLQRVLLVDGPAAWNRQDFESSEAHLWLGELLSSPQTDRLVGLSGDS